MTYTIRETPSYEDCPLCEERALVLWNIGKLCDHLVKHHGGSFPEGARRVLNYDGGRRVTCWCGKTFNYHPKYVGIDKGFFDWGDHLLRCNGVLAHLFALKLGVRP